MGTVGEETNTEFCYGTWGKGLTSGKRRLVEGQPCHFEQLILPKKPAVRSFNVVERGNTIEEVTENLPIVLHDKR